MTLTISAFDARILPNGDVAVDLGILLDNIDIGQVIAHYSAEKLLCAMEWADIKRHIDEVKISAL